MAKFNHDLPYGEHSPIENGKAYWQNGNHFDTNYNHVNAAGDIVDYAEDQTAPHPKLKQPKESGAERKARQDAEINGRKKNVNTAAKNADDAPAKAPPGGGLNLVDWANGKGPKGVQWFSVRKQLEDEGFDPLPQTAAEAREAIKARAA